MTLWNAVLILPLWASLVAKPTDNISDIDNWHLSANQYQQ